MIRKKKSTLFCTFHFQKILNCNFFERQWKFLKIIFCIKKFFLKISLTWKTEFVYVSICFSN